MKVVVTGGAGYVGSHVVAACLEAGYEVAVIDDLSTGVQSNVPQHVELWQLDIADNAPVQAHMRKWSANAVIHCAASVSAPNSIIRPDAYYRNNVQGSRLLFEASFLAGVEVVVLSSSAAIYGESHLPVREESIKFPTTPYGRTKMICEWMLKDFCEAYGFKGVALRYFNVAGADCHGRCGPTMHNSSVIRVAIQAALLHRPFNVYGSDWPTRDGTAERDYVSVCDLAQGHVQALKYANSMAHTMEAFNLGYGETSTVEEIVKAVEVVHGQRIATHYKSRRDGDVAYSCAVPDKAQHRLGFTNQSRPLSLMVENMYRWEKSRLTVGKVMVRDGVGPA